MLITKCTDRIVFDGRVIQWPEIVMMPPASHFTFVCMGLTKWLSLSVTSGMATGATNGGFKKYLAAIEGGKTLITPPADELVKFIDAATAARKDLQCERPKHLQAIEASLLEILAAFCGIGQRKALL